MNPKHSSHLMHKIGYFLAGAACASLIFIVGLAINQTQFFSTHTTPNHTKTVSPTQYATTTTATIPRQAQKHLTAIPPRSAPQKLHRAPQPPLVIAHSVPLPHNNTPNSQNPASLHNATSATGSYAPNENPLVTQKLQRQPQKNNSPRSLTPPPKQQHQRAYLELFANVYSEVITQYIYAEKATPKQLITGALRGMLATLDDPHTVFFDSSAYERFKQNAQGRYQGIGIYVVEEGGFFKIVNVIENSPAWESGLKQGDLIENVDTIPLKGKSIDEVVDLILGESGSLVKILVRRQDRQLAYTLKRRQVILKSVYHSMLSPEKLLKLPPNLSTTPPAQNREVGYVRIHRFANNTPHELKTSLNVIKNQHARGVILDLRNNPGGLLSAAIEMVDFFVNSGPIVSTRDRSATTTPEYATRQLLIPKYIPIVILINKYSASASEIFAGALMDYGRAMSIGEASFGKFSVQKEFSYTYPEQVGFKMTIAKYLLPSGKTFEKIGIPVSLPIANPNNFSPNTLKATYAPQDTQLMTALAIIRNKQRYQSYLKANITTAR